VVGEVATLVSSDEDIEAWDNLEYERLKVGLLKSNSANLSKNMWINGEAYHIHVEEEMPSQGGGLYRCNCSSYASSDSVSSKDSVVEETLFSVRKNVDGEGYDGGGGGSELFSERDKRGVCREGFA